MAQMNMVQALNSAMDIMLGRDPTVVILGEDVGVFTTMRFEPGNLTRSDRVLGRFFEYLRAYPRAHPSAPWIC